jgi:hypothetical protein
MDMPSCHRDCRRSTISGNQTRCASPFGMTHHSTVASQPRTFYVVPLRRSDLSYDGLRFDSEPIVHGHRTFCLHLRVPLCRLDGNAAEQKLDLIEPDAGGWSSNVDSRVDPPKDGYRAHGIENSAAFSQ